MTNTFPTSFALTDSIIFTGETFVERQSLLITNGKIVDLVPSHQIPTDVPTISCAHQILAPAYIDCQVNGGGNAYFTDEPTLEALNIIASAHLKTGTTRLVPTVISDTPEKMMRCASVARTARKSNQSILGFHFEGPHLTPSLSGAHDMSLIRPINEQDLQNYVAQDNEVFILTLCPDQVTPDQIRTLAKQGVIVCIGHSAASLDQAREAIKAGVSGFTHIMTRMPPIKTREPGIAVLALNDTQTYAGLIADGFHIDPELVRLVVRAKAADKLFMVSDAAPSAGAEIPAPYNMGGVRVIPKDGKCVNDNGVLAGAQKTLGECVPTAIKDIRLDPERVLRMASTIPAEFLGLGDQFGKLLPNYTADIVALDHGFKTTAVWQSGVKVI